MLGTGGLQFRRGGHGDDRLYSTGPVKARRHQNQNQNHFPQQNQNPNQIQKQRPVVSTKGKSVILDNVQPQPDNQRVVAVVESEEPVVSVTTAAASSSSDESVSVTVTETETDSCFSNLDRFLESTTPCVTAQYLSTTRIRGSRMCDVEYQPYFVLEDLWESFKEWSAYGAGVPLVLNDTDSVVQYYVPYLSGVQIYGESARTPTTRRAGGDSGYYRDSSSDGSSDSDLEMRLRHSKEQWNTHAGNGTTLRLGRNTLRDNHVALQEGSSSDDSEAGNSQGDLLFEYLERDPPYSREPLACKILDLARRFPELKTLRSCDMLPNSWISVAWYPIYRIPTGPTLKDLDACFLTFHSLSTPTSGASTEPAPKMSYPNGTEGVHKISLPIFGLASYKLRGSMWIPNGSFERQMSNSLLQAADNWLRLLQVNHPDFQFFSSHGTFRR